jgi:hypothetical protein
MLDELREQHPKVFDLIAGGDQTTYEGTLVGDYIAGRFHELSETSVAEGTYAVGMVGA